MSGIVRLRMLVRRVLGVLGPGLIAGASNNDPSAIGTYSVAGASTGFATLWTPLVTFPMMAVPQYLAAKIGLVTGMGVAGVLRKHYPRAVVYPLMMGLALGTVVTAGADLGAIAAAVNLLAPIPIAVLVVAIGCAILVFQVWGTLRVITGTLKWLTLTLFAYIGVALLTRPHLAAVLRGTFIPTLRLDNQFLFVLVAVLGATLSPYLWFWQASQEAEAWAPRSHRPIESALRHAVWDINLGMGFSNLVMYFIILAAGATLFASGRGEIKSAADAAEALRPLVGNGATVLFALGVIGTGMLTVPVYMSSAAYVVAESFGWRASLAERPGQALGFYAVLAMSTLAGLLLNLAGINPVDALVWTSVVFGFMTPPLLAGLLIVANNRGIMGDHVNGTGVNILGWATTVIMSAAAAALVWTWRK